MIECCYLWGGFGVGSWDGQFDRYNSGRSTTSLN